MMYNFSKTKCSTFELNFEFVYYIFFRDKQKSYQPKTIKSKIKYTIYLCFYILVCLSY